jgi:hypothetical protein
VRAALDGDAQARRAGRPDDLRDLRGVGGERDGGGTLVDREVPRLPDGVVVLVGRGDEPGPDTKTRESGTGQAGSFGAFWGDRRYDGGSLQLYVRQQL